MTGCKHSQFVIMPRKIILLVLLALTAGAAEFTEVPHSVRVNAGEIAIFECQHPSADFIRWRIHANAHLLRDPYPPGITTPTIGRLHILGHPNYNGTRIACVTFTPFRIISPTVTLTVYEGFMKIPISLNLTLHQEAVHTCELKNAGNIIWSINGTLHTQHLPPSATVDNHGNTSILRFSSCINNTAIECHAAYGFGLSERSPSVLMKCQGLLGAIHNFVTSGIDSITWEAPFSLDLTTISVNILYCLDVYNITCGGKVLKISDCNLNDTHFIIAPVDYVFELTISPRSNVPNSRNGTSFSWKAEAVEGNLTEVTLRMLPSRELTIGLTLSLAEKKSPSEIYPALYSMSAIPTDGVDHARLNCSTTANSTLGTMISLIADCSVPIDRLYSIQVWAFGCYQHLISNGTELSTHRVQITSIRPLRMGGVQVVGKFLSNSEITGFLAIFYSNMDRNAVHYYLVSKPPNKLNFKRVLGGKLSGQFAISIFATGEDNLPLPRAIGIPRIVKVKASQDLGVQEKASIEYSINQNSTGVAVTCRLKSINLTGCLVLIHQRITQLSSSGLVSIASFNIQNRSGDIAHRFFPGLDLEHDQIGVVGGKMIIQSRSVEPGPDDKIWTKLIIGVIVGVLAGIPTKFLYSLIGTVIFVPIAVAPVVLCYIRWRRKQDTMNVEYLLSRLQPYASKWFYLGKALSVDEYQLLEILRTRNARDEDNLKEILTLYMARPDLRHSWKAIEAALKTINSSTTAVQTTTPDYLGQQGVFVSYLETTFQTTTQKQSNLFHLQECTVHDQCQDDLTTENSHQIEESLTATSEFVVPDRKRPYRQTARRSNTRQLSLQTFFHAQDENGTTVVPFSGRAGDHTPPTINSPVETVNDTSDHECTSGPNGTVEKQNVGEDTTNATLAIYPTQESNATN